MKFLNACAVLHGADNDLIECGITTESVNKGDFVVLENGTRGFVTVVALINTEGPELALLSSYTEVNEVVDIYSHSWSKEENND